MQVSAQAAFHRALAVVCSRTARQPMPTAQLNCQSRTDQTRAVDLRLPANMLAARCTASLDTELALRVRRRSESAAALHTASPDRHKVRAMSERTDSVAPRRGLSLEPVVRVSETRRVVLLMALQGTTVRSSPQRSKTVTNRDANNAHSSR